MLSRMAIHAHATSGVWFAVGARGMGVTPQRTASISRLGSSSTCFFTACPNDTQSLHFHGGAVHRRALRLEKRGKVT